MCSCGKQGVALTLSLVAVTPLAPCRPPRGALSTVPPLATTCQVQGALRYVHLSGAPPAGRSPRVLQGAAPGDTLPAGEGGTRLQGHAPGD